ncbi:2-dehydro-3-deoxyglucarate aldolase [Plantibacter sp. VKM Ac-2876]|nr:aldolase/citrate lyase family protein [Plantibacter sp. VKM Ac-2876]MBF4564599.1 2-dehydro-3-deoxyglucarate aldolase [Plantibacter sp. VKM Ac-2876]
MPAEELVEMAAVAGFDFVLIDTEHGPADVVALRQHIALASIHGVPVIVRVAEHDTAQVLRILDQGAQGIVAPHLDSAADAAAVVDAAMYPPVGSRGFATYSRAGRFGLTPPEEHSRWFLEHTLLIGMVESPAGVAAVGEIVVTPRLDGILVGPADLAASSGPEDPSVSDSIAAVHAELARSGALRMDIVGTRAAAAESFADGAGLVVVNLAHALMAELRGFVAGQR